MKNKQFEEWLKDSSIMYQFYVDGYTWDRIPFSMQWGVYLEFFDSVGIDLEYEFNFIITHWTQFFKKRPTRTEAQQEAIKKAFEIIENK